MRAVLRGSVVCVIVTLVLTPLAYSQDPTRAEKRAMPLTELQHKAERATGVDARATREFVDEVLNESIFRAAPESVRTRVASAEHAFLNGKHRGISEDALVTASNR